ncbi:ESX-1 secretion-associated protein [Mycobacterium sp. pV006]|uniref:ESX-1 secretion-associated protein n=1 Tax=Mycobacterium sp. pV006 TaxID=3238983 RepID=UPI00351B6E42
MHEALHVVPEHLRVLAGTQAQAAQEIMTAAEATTGVEDRIRLSHGTVAWPCTASVAAVTQARHRAAQRLARRAEKLSDGLATSAVRYQHTDATSGSDLSRQMPQHPPGNP